MMRFFIPIPKLTEQKGSSDVCSLLHHMIYNHMNEKTRDLYIFCDSCAGQNKNWTMFRYLHHIIHFQKRLDYIHITFPVRGHSYLECDKDFALVNQKHKAEIPEDWIAAFQSARMKPSAFITEKVELNFFRRWESQVQKFYKKTCPFPTRSVKELKLSKENPRLVYFRDSYNGLWKSSDIVGKRLNNEGSGRESEMPDFSYEGNFFFEIFKVTDFLTYILFISF